MGRRTEDDAAEIIEQSGRYALIRDADGHAIYDLDLAADADPVASFPPDDAGSDAAWERYGRLIRAARRDRFGLVRVLIALVLIGVGVWIVTGIGYAWMISGVDRNGSFLSGRWWAWVQAADSVAYHVWVGALAVLVVLWLRRRFEPDPAPSAPRRRDVGDRGSDPAVP